MFLKAAITYTQLTTQHNSAHGPGRTHICALLCIATTALRAKRQVGLDTKRKANCGTCRGAATTCCRPPRQQQRDQASQVSLLPQPTFAILPRCVPGQAEKRREEDDRSGHSSISEPHLISAMPLPRLDCRGPGSWRRVASLPRSVRPSVSLSLSLQDVVTGVGAGIRGRPTVKRPG